MRLVLCAAAVCFLPVTAHAQAFGIQMGESVTTLPSAKGTGPGGTDFSIEPPEPDPFFDSYRVFATDLAGICNVRAKRSGDIDKMLEEFPMVVEHFKSIYGQPAREWPGAYMVMWEGLASIDEIILKVDTVAVRFINEPNCKSSKGWQQPESRQ